VVFDCDGVLVDSEPVSYRAWQDAIALHGHHLTEEEFEASIGTTDRMVAELWAPKLGTTADVLDDQAKQAFLARADELQVFADALALRATIDVPVAIGTNSARWRLDTVLAATGLGELFEVSVTASDVVNPKPAPDIYLRAFEGIGVAAPRGLVLEDSPSGTKAARAAGAYVVAVDRGVIDRALLSPADQIVGTLHPGG
jgi:HAD superfamily hydrolase (TIGR01509 family)